jgi:flavin reductase (DIM6/NTAB) family NADH-FMN oxidoreductase RutF
MAAPGGSGPVGPYPPGVETDEQQVDYDKRRRRVLWSLPSGLYVVGSAGAAGADGRPVLNAMTTNWVTQVAFEPKLLGIGVEKPALTHRLITEGGVFSVCTVAREDRTIVRKFTKPVEVDHDARTLNGFAFHTGVTGAPILDQAPAYLDCEVRQAVDVGTHTFFIGEVLDSAFQGDEGTEVLRMEDTRMNYGG